MKTHKLISTLFIIAFFSALSSYSYGKNFSFSSSEARTSLIELYTSEGCSSCPPADQWLSKLKNNKNLWSSVVPIAFHVDYWDYLGWKDEFANPQFTERQYIYQKLKYLSTVYTPGVMKNGREWRGWRWWQSPNSRNKEKAGILSATANQENLSVTYTNFIQSPSDLVLNIALLGMNIHSRIQSGENAGKILVHDFVVLDFQQHIMTKSTNGAMLAISNPIHSFPNKTDAIAIWVNTKNDPTPLQATGSWVN